MSRVARRDARRSRRTLAVGVAVVALAALAALAVSRLDGGEGTAPSVTPSPSASLDPSDLAVVSVTGADHAFVAVVGAGGGRASAALAFEPGTTLVVPGQGETVLEDLAALDGDGVRIGISNAIGAWIPHYLVTDLDRLGALVDRVGGLRVVLADAFTVAGRVVGPGETLLSGAQVAAYLKGAGDDALIRWTSVLEALLAAAPPIQPGDLADTDDAGAAAAILGDAKGAVVDMAPTEVVLASVIVPRQPESDLLVRELFGTQVLARVLIQNGSGAPGVGEDVARLLLPAGFRIVLSQNAESFDHDVTQIIASSDDVADLAQAAREALGVGLVEVAQVPSGLADVTIVVGKDFAG